jgi:uncharacterized protein (TIGR02246 family)
MRKWIIALGIVVVTLGMSACAPAPEPAEEPMAPAADPAADKAAIAAVGQAMRDALAAGDIDGVLATYTADAIMMSPNRAPFRGQDEIRAFIDSMATAFTSVEWVAGESEALVGGDYGYELVELSMNAQIEGGESMSDRAMQVRIYERQDDGSWKIARDIWSLSGSGEATGDEAAPAE